MSMYGLQLVEAYIIYKFCYTLIVLVILTFASMCPFTMCFMLVLTLFVLLLRSQELVLLCILT